MNFMQGFALGSIATTLYVVFAHPWLERKVPLWMGWASFDRTGFCEQYGHAFEAPDGLYGKRMRCQTCGLVKDVDA